VRVEESTIWLNQKSLAELFQTTTRNIGMHLQNIFEEEELNEASTTKDFFLVRLEGSRKVNRTVKHSRPFHKFSYAFHLLRKLD